MRTPSCFAVVILSVAAAVPALAQQPPASATDARWTAWLGCWQQLEETVRGSNVVEPGGHRDTVATEGVMVCVTPAADPSSVTMSTIIEKQSALAETVAADGTNRAIDEPGCTGTQRAQWSENGRRLFAHAKLACADGTTREISGLTTIAPGPTWVDIQVVKSTGRESIRVRRYRRAYNQSAHVASQVTAEQLAAAATAAARQALPFSLDEVKEAAGKVAPSTVEAALIETDATFPLNAKRLQELDAAGVPDRVLDLMIALSFPNRFVVERRTSSSYGSLPIGGIGGVDWIGAEYDLPYSYFPYHYAPFGYGMWGRYDNYYYGVPVYAVETVTEIQPSGQGRVVDGLGYTRVRARDPQPANLGGFGDSGVSSAGGSSSGHSGGVSSQGYSGGGGGDSGRTAVARPPG